MGRGRRLLGLLSGLGLVACAIAWAVKSAEWPACPNPANLAVLRFSVVGGGLGVLATVLWGLSLENRVSPWHACSATALGAVTMLAGLHTSAALAGVRVPLRWASSPLQRGCLRPYLIPERQTHLPDRVDLGSQEFLVRAAELSMWPELRALTNGLHEEDVAVAVVSMRHLPEDLRLACRRVGAAKAKEASLAERDYQWPAAAALWAEAARLPGDDNAERQAERCRRNAAVNSRPEVEVLARGSGPGWEGAPGDLQPLIWCPPAASRGRAASVVAYIAPAYVGRAITFEGSVRNASGHAVGPVEREFALVDPASGIFHSLGYHLLSTAALPDGASAPFSVSLSLPRLPQPGGRSSGAGCSTTYHTVSDHYQVFRGERTSYLIFGERVFPFPEQGYLTVRDGRASVSVHPGEVSSDNLGGLGKLGALGPDGGGFELRTEYLLQLRGGPAWMVRVIPPAWGTTPWPQSSASEFPPIALRVAREPLLCMLAGPDG